MTGILALLGMLTIVGCILFLGGYAVHIITER